MSELYIPPEIVDYILDFLRDQPEALKQCCLVSKSFIPPTRTHLFNHVDFEESKHLKAWGEIFSEHADSPAIYTRSLAFHHTESIVEMDLKCVRSFSNVVRLDLRGHYQNQLEPGDCFILFHGLLPAVKSLCLSWSNIPLRSVFNLICTFPHLEDLDVEGFEPANDNGVISLSSPLPVLTGSLSLKTVTANFASRLLELSSTFRLRKIIHRPGFMDEFEGVESLVGKCSGTLECLDIRSRREIDLSRATNLKKVAFMFDRTCATQAVTTTLGTIKSQHFRKVKITLPNSFQPQNIKPTHLGEIVEDTYARWMDLDRTLAKFSAIRVKLVTPRRRLTHEDIEHLFPKMTAIKPNVLEFEVVDKV